MMRLRNQALPTGIKALHEAVLLGRALINLVPDSLERNVLVSEAWDAARIPLKGVSVHVTFTRHFRTVDEHYVIADDAGGGRHTHRHDPTKGSTYELSITLGDTPCQDRFARLHRYLSKQRWTAQVVGRPGGSPTVLAWWQFVDSAYHTAAGTSLADRASSTLVRLADELVPQIAVPEGRELTWSRWHETCQG